MSSQLLKKARTIHNSVLTACEKHLPEASSLLDRDREAHGLPPLRLQEGMAQGKALAFYFATFEASEEALERETLEDSDIRKRRDSTSEALYVSMVKLGSLVLTSYERSVAERLRVTGTTPRTHKSLLAYAQGFLNATSTLPDLPPLTDTWSSLDLPAARAHVASLVDGLKRQQLEVDREVRESQYARHQRNLAQENWYKELDLTIAVLRMALRAANQPELADRLLPTERQIRQLEPALDEDTTEPTAADPEPSEA